MDKILVIGGAGFIGYNLADSLSINHEVHILDNFQRGKKDLHITNLINKKNVKLIDDDLIDESVISRLSNDYNYIFQFAAIVGVQNVVDQPYHVLHKNFVINHNALLLAEAQKNLKCFIFTSTSEVQSNSPKYLKMPFPTSESFPICLPNLQEERSTYMLSKIYGEAMCYQKNIPCIILRPHNIYGPRMGMSHVIPEILHKIHVSEKNDKIEVKSPKHMRAFCYIDDAIMLMEKLIFNSEVTHLNDVYNIGNSESEVSIESLVKILLEVTGRNDLEIFPAEDTKGSPSRRCPDLTKTLAVAAVSPKVKLFDGCKLTWEWYRETF